MTKDEIGAATAHMAGETPFFVAGLDEMGKRVASPVAEVEIVESSSSGPMAILSPSTEHLGTYYRDFILNFQDTFAGHEHMGNAELKEALDCYVRRAIELLFPER